MPRALPLLLLSASALAAPLPWQVQDEATAELLLAQIEALWPEAPVSLHATVDPDVDHLALEEDALVWVRGGRRFTRAWDGEPATAVLLARTWLRSVDIEDGGWTPDRPEWVREPVEVAQSVTEPERHRFRIPIPAPTPVVGVGLRSAPTSGIPVDGLRALAGARWGHTTVSATGFIATGSYAGETAADRRMEAVWVALVDPDLDEVRRQSFIDVWTLDLGLNYTPLEPRERGVSVAPSLIGALELRRSVLRETWYEREVDPETFEVTTAFNTGILTRQRAFDVGPVIGAGLVLGIGPSAHIRVAGLDRIRYRKLSPSSPRRWDHEVVLTTDLLIEL